MSIFPLTHLTALALFPGAILNAGETVGFNRDVRPILSENCFFCHGPDKAKQKAGLRLDSAEAAFAALKDSEGHAIVPGKLEESEVWHRIGSTDPDEVMPPPKSKLALSAEEKAVLKKWIEQGAKYEAHWSFVPLPEKVAVPRNGAARPIDAFVLEKLAQEKLKPAPPADPLRWLRRATLDLTGLPPTLAEIAAFEKDVAAQGEAAFSKAADRLLGTRGFGENWAVMWLDGARYGDTSGYHSDVTFNNWPYRDWVVRAFNADMPYDQFITWQLAGDLLPGATREQILATAFNRLHRITNEGGSVWEEFRVDGVADRVHTMGTTMLGLTMECSRCHDHKYDPISQRDYYSLFAFFNSINETGVFNHESIAPPPSLVLPSEEQERDLAVKKAAVEDLEKQLSVAGEAAAADFEQWLADPLRDMPMPDKTGYFTFDENAEPLKNRGTFLPPSKMDKEGKPIAGGKPRGHVAKVESPQFVPGKFGTAIRLDGDRGVFFPDYFLKDRWTPFTQAMWLRDTVRDAKPVVVTSRCFGHDVGYNGIQLDLEDGWLHARVFRSWPDNGLGIRGKVRVPQNEWAHVAFTYDGSSRVEGLRLFLNGQPLEVEVTGARLNKSASSKTIREGDFRLGSIFRGRGFKGGEVDELRCFDRALTPPEIAKLSGKSDPADPSAQRAYYLSAIHPETRRLTAELEVARKAVVEREDSFLEVSVMRELPQPRPAWVLARGAYDAPRADKDRVVPDSIQSLTPFPKDAPRNRLGLAQWLTAPDHPLTSRVMVNRVWARFFGRGLLGTVENFGLQGELPTHPELLDWLSRDFISSGWKMKHLCRQIVLSATYRQQTAAGKEVIARDPDNRLLARGPAHRLTAEAIRDLALAASGLLDEKKDGPPVRPYDPVNNGKPDVKQVHSRSLFSYWRRTRPIPNMTALDRPSMEVCIVKRSRTNSPAQALVLLNDVQFVEAARALAVDILKTDGTAISRIGMAWQRLTGTQPIAAEMELLADLYRQQFATFSQAPAEATKLLKVGLTPAPTGIDSAQAAAMTVVCQAILNSDAAIWKR